MRKSAVSGRELAWTLLLAVGRPGLLHPGALSRSEKKHAVVVGVVHKVVDRIYAASGAGVAPGGAAVGRGALGLGVIDLVTALTTILEGVIEPQPLSDLVGVGVALVVGRRRAAIKKKCLFVATLLVAFYRSIS